MGKILIGVATAALWFALSHVANAAPVSKPGCNLQAPAISTQIGR
jgi:hypothetical protein